MSSRSILPLLLTVLFFSGLSAQNSFQKIYDDGGVNTAASLLPADGSNYLLVGGHVGPSEQLLSYPWLTKVDSSGEVLWRKGYTMPRAATFLLGTKANDGGYLLYGRAGGTLGIPEDFVTKVDADGNWQWSRDFINSFIGTAMQAVPDGYIIAGNGGGASVLKLDNSGNLVWRTSYGAFIQDMAVINDTIYAVGSHLSQPAFYALNAIDEGAVYFAKTFQDTTTSFGQFEQIGLAPDGNFILLGGKTLPVTSSQPFHSVISVQKITRNGTLLLSKYLSLENEDQLQLPMMAPTADGGAILQGYLPNHPIRREILVKLTATMQLDAAFAYPLSNNGAGEAYRLRTRQTADGGFLTLRDLDGGKITLTKTRPDLQVTGCCIQPLPVKVTESPNILTDLTLTTGGYAQLVHPLEMSTIFNTYPHSDYCQAMTIELADTLAFCAGDSVLIGENWYSQPGTVVDTTINASSCDTVTTYTLQVLSQPAKNQHIELCAGESVVIDGVTYTQADTIVATLPATTGCDTLVTYILQVVPQPVKNQLIEFCAGDSVMVNGVTYTHPDTIVATLPAMVGCDTLVTYVLSFTTLSTSTVTIQCPANITVPAATGSQSAVVSYAAPVVETDCACGGTDLNQTLGLVSGSSFPAGSNQVCYRATDVCGSLATCCFTIQVDAVTEENACDVKTTSCVKFELLKISQNPAGQKTYRLRVTNTCSNQFLYTAFQLPNGVVADAPSDNSTYTTAAGRNYTVRNANESPFYSIRFKSNGAGIANGQSDIFEYTLPPQAAPLYILAAAKLDGQPLYEAHLNVFNCPVQAGANKPENEANARSVFSPITNTALNVFPNPFTDQLTVAFDLETAGSAELRLTDLSGRVLFSEKENLAAGTQQFSWQTASLANGMYVVGLKVTGSGWTYRKVALVR